MSCIFLDSSASLAQPQVQGLDPDDPTNSYMLQAGARLCKCLGAEFVPYLTVVMPPLLRAAELKPDINVQTSSDSEEVSDLDDEVNMYTNNPPPHLLPFPRPSTLPQVYVRASKNSKGYSV